MLGAPVVTPDRRRGGPLTSADGSDPLRCERTGQDTLFSSSQMGSNSHSELLLAQAVPAITRRWNIGIAHVSHRRIRTGPASVVAQSGGQFRLGRQSGGVHPSSMGLIFRNSTSSRGRDPRSASQCPVEAHRSPHANVFSVAQPSLSAFGHFLGHSFRCRSERKRAVRVD